MLSQHAAVSPWIWLSVWCFFNFVTFTADLACCLWSEFDISG